MFIGLQVIDMPEHNPGQMGGTMRLGKRRTIFKSNTSVLSEDIFYSRKIIFLLPFTGTSIVL